MKNFRNVIVVVLVIGWLVSSFIFHLGGIIHILPVIAFFIVMVRLTREKKME